MLFFHGKAIICIVSCSMCTIIIITMHLTCLLVLLRDTINYKQLTSIIFHIFHLWAPNLSQGLIINKNDPAYSKSTWFSLSDRILYFCYSAKNDVLQFSCTLWWINCRSPEKLFQFLWRPRKNWSITLLAKNARYVIPMDINQKFGAFIVSKICWLTSC